MIFVLFAVCLIGCGISMAAGMALAYLESGEEANG